jgi:hypothetical protein
LPWKTEAITNNIVPMFVPIRTNKRNEIKEKLASHNVFCPIHWPLPSSHARKLSNSIYSEELSLIIDQRYSIQDMNLIIDIVDSCIA